MSKLGYVYELVLDVNKLLGYNFLNKYTVVYTNKTMVYCKVNGSDCLKGFERISKTEYGWPKGNLYTIDDLKSNKIFKNTSTCYVLDENGYFKFDENFENDNYIKILSAKRRLKKKTDDLKIKEFCIKKSQESIETFIKEKEELSDEISFLYKLLKELEEKEEEK